MNISEANDMIDVIDKISKTGYSLPSEFIEEQKGLFSTWLLSFQKYKSNNSVKKIEVEIVNTKTEITVLKKLIYQMLLIWR